jgi:hypothetical protein
LVLAVVILGDMVMAGADMEVTTVGVDTMVMAAIEATTDTKEGGLVLSQEQ